MINLSNAADIWHTLGLKAEEIRSASHSMASFCSLSPIAPSECGQSRTLDQG